MPHRAILSLPAELVSFVENVIATAQAVRRQPPSPDGAERKSDVRRTGALWFHPRPVAARADGIIHATTTAGIETLAGTGYHAVGGTVRTLVRRRPGRGLKPFNRLANTAHTEVRAPGERGIAQLKAQRALH